MKNKKNIIIGLAIIIVILVIFLVYRNVSRKEKIEGKDFKIVTSFYPVYIMTENITKGAKNIEVVNMADTAVGCIHDYTLTTTDLKKIENADVFIQNGLGLENFTDKVLDTYPGIKVIESAKEIEDMLEAAEPYEETLEHNHEHEDVEQVEGTEEDDVEHHHHEDGVNVHSWISIDRYIVQIKEIAQSLSEVNPENKQVYMDNLERYIVQLNSLKEKYKQAEEKIKGKYIISLNEAFEYFNENIDINIITVETNHERDTFSAEMLKSIIEESKQKNIGVIVVDKDDSLKNAEAIAGETGAKVCTLDSGLTGKNDLMSYIKSMENNLKVLENI
ncbi:MAG: metal ABC transporter substrate-binding protein [Clostridia bacterium]|nr:metal ABC transporter substrate-binding protein [Clostridia bacterium]